MVIRAPVLLLRKAYADFTYGAGMVLAVSVGLGLAAQTDHGGAVHTLRGGGGAQPAAVQFCHGGASGPVYVARVEQASVAVCPCGFEQTIGRHVALDEVFHLLETKNTRAGSRRARRRIELRRGVEPIRTLAEHIVRIGGQVVNVAVFDQIHRQRISTFHVLRQMRVIHCLEVCTAAQRANRATSGKQ